MKLSLFIFTLVLGGTTAFTPALLATRAIKKSAPAKPVKAAGTRAVKKAAPKPAAKKVVAVAKPVARAPAKPVKAAGTRVSKGGPDFAGLFDAVKKAAPKPAAKKVVAVAKPVARKALVAKKPVAKKPVAKKPVARKALVAKKPVAKKPVARKPVARQPVARKPPPKSTGRPSFDTSNIRIKNVSGSGLFPRAVGIQRPNFSDPKLQIKRDPAFYKAAAQERMRKLSSAADFSIDDGLTEIERKQRNGGLSDFLSGSAKSQADKSTIVGEIEAPAFGGLSQDRFQLLFITVFGLLTLVGSLTGAY